jgi:Fic family protein
MSKVVTQHWEACIDSGLPRKDRATCDYEAYIPDPVSGREFKLLGDVAAAVVDAEVAVARFDSQAMALVDTEALARLLLRAESVASSKIEGLEVGAGRLFKAEVAASLGEPAQDVTANEVLRNVQAMTWALQTAQPRADITLPTLLEAHRRLLAGTRLEQYGGQVRTEQNWIGGSSYNPCSASFVPPPHEVVNELLSDFLDFCNSDALPAVAQAAIAHAQFETIHPFIDGNGRIGRVLIQLVLRRRSLTTRILPPISLVLATWANEYVSGLTATRYIGDPDDAPAIEGLNRWVGLFAAACRRAVRDAVDFEERVRSLQSSWRSTLGSYRQDSATDRLLRSLPGAPIVTVASAARLIERTFQATNEAISRLTKAGILHQVTVGRRNRAFEASELIRLFTDLERQLASPEGNTRRSPITRPVPYRSTPRA